MKQTLIFAALIFFAACMGCSHSLNISGPQDLHKSAISEQKTAPLVWSKDELTVRATSELIVEEKCSFTSEANSDIPEYYRIEFDVYTNVDKLMNQYYPIVAVSKDGETVFQSSSFPDGNSEEISHIMLKLDNTSFSAIKFYIALMQNGYVPVASVPVSTLTLYNIVLYRVH